MPQVMGNRKAPSINSQHSLFLPWLEDDKCALFDNILKQADVGVSVINKLVMNSWAPSFRFRRNFKDKIGILISGGEGL